MGMTLAERLAYIDSRPAHPEDYLDDLNSLVEKYGEDLIDSRLHLLEKHDMWSGYLELLRYLRTGQLLDSYTGKVIFDEKDKKTEKGDKSDE